MNTQPLNKDASKGHESEATMLEFSFNSKLNVEFLEKSYSGNIGFAKRMFSIFLSTIDEDLTNLDNYIRLNDYQGIKDVAHKVKNNFTWVGLPMMSSIMYKIESSAREESDFVHELYSDFVAIFQERHSLVKEEYNRINTYLV